MAPLAIDVKGIVKNFGSKRALKNISFEVRRGTIHGYLGHNAAGKTTTIRIALGLLVPNEGRIRIFGEALTEKPEIKARIGYVSEWLGLYPSATLKENLVRFCELRGTSKVHETVDRLIQEVELQEFADVKVKKLSAGTKQRLAIARALAGAPELLILDEPMSNLDPVQRNKLKKKFEEMKRRGCTIFMSTHILGDVEELCDCVTIIKEGQILFSGTLEELRRKVSFEHPVVKILTSHQTKACRILSRDYHVTKSRDGALLVAIEKRDEVPRIARAVSGFDVYELRLLEPSLESIYTSLHEVKK
jgi:ABC-2 type transport system ATP-binding protein